TGSPRTDHGTLEINYLAVRPERVEGRAANCDTLSKGREFEWGPFSPKERRAIPFLTVPSKGGHDPHPGPDPREKK
ncbi:MAG TPA: hypothetical protein VLK23_16030, partial [Thermodesulfobacteriota bacterium]|nr:hypothetical protein [Thermodesulfobacteriota bacterium]